MLCNGNVKFGEQNTFMEYFSQLRCNSAQLFGSSPFLVWGFFVGFFPLICPAFASDAPDSRSVEAPVTAAASSDASEEARFAIYEYVLDGASLLPEVVLEQAVKAFMGEQRTIADVDKARASLEKAYHDAGFMTVLVTIPEQRVDEGSVTLTVTEAPLRKLAVKGAEYTLPSAVMARVPELAEGKVPNFNKLQDQLNLLNESGTLRVVPVLRAGTLPGTVDVQLDVEDRNPVTWNVELNNRQSANTTPFRLAGTIRYDNLWQLGHSFTLSTQLAPQRIEDARVLSGTYVFPYDSVGNTATVYLVASRSQFATLSGAPGLGLIGNSDTLGVRFNTKLDSGAGYRYVASYGADYKDLRQTLLANANGQTLSETPVRYVPLVGNLNAGFFGDTSRLSLDATATLGLRGMLSDDDAAFNARRGGTSASFMSLRSNLNYLQTVGRWAAVSRVTAQMAAQPLLPSEQLIAGGADTVRGYLEGERAGDYGFSASFELRSPSQSWRKGQPDWFVDGKAFIDVAKVAAMRTSTPGVSYSLASAGAGLRWNGPAGVTLNAEVAHAFVDGSMTSKGDNRVHFSLIGAF